MRFVLALVLLVMWAASANAHKPSCERVLEAEDVFIDVKDLDLTIVIVNTRDQCDLIFADWLKTGPGEEDAWPFLGVRVETSDGEVLSGGWGANECMKLGWFSSFEKPYATMLPELRRSTTRLAPGTVRVKRWTIGHTLRGLDGVRTGCNLRALPWGTDVVMRVGAQFGIDLDWLAGRDVPGLSKTLEVVTPRFIVSLPKTPVR